MTGAWTAIGFLAIAAVVTGVPALLEDPGPPALQGAFTRHITTALAINLRRRPIYAAMTHGVSIPLSDQVIGDERLARIVARYFDWQAAPFNREGIGIVRDDFTPMVPMRPATASPSYTGLTPDTDLADLRKRVEAFDRQARDEIAKDDFSRIAAEAYDLSTRIEDVEARTRSNLVMTRHLVDEIGFASMHAIGYHDQSGGRIDGLERRFLDVLLIPVPLGLDADRQAQAAQAMGAGILVNDLPDIPFCSQWSKRSITSGGRTISERKSLH